MQSNFYFAQYGLLQSMVCTMIDVQTNSITAEFIVPSEYQAVEYIQSTGTQWIDSGYTPTVNVEIETDLNRQSQSETWGVFFGLTGNDRSSDGILARIYNGSSTTLNLWFCNTTYSDCQIATTINARHNLILKKNGGTFDGTAYTIATNSTPYQTSLVLFGGNNGGSKGWRCGKLMIKTFKITDNGAVQREFIPCYRKSDGVIGMRDRIGKQFYTNAGSGSFTKGPNIN